MLCNAFSAANKLRPIKVATAFIMENIPTRPVCTFFVSATAAMVVEIETARSLNFDEISINC